MARRKLNHKQSFPPFVLNLLDYYLKCHDLVIKSFWTSWLFPLLALSTIDPYTPNSHTELLTHRTSFLDYNDPLIL